LGIPLSRIHEITKIDMWFLKQYEALYIRKEISNFKVETAKRIVTRSETKGFADRQIAHDGLFRKPSAYVGTTMNIQSYSNWLILAAEFKAKTPYYYSTFEAEIESRWNALC
jgi:carbamoyl-phosphate synthase large subunit